MSRPTTTIPPSAARARWRASSAARTSGTRATADTAPSTASLRIESVASSPSSRTRVSLPVPSSPRLTRAASGTRPPASSSRGALAERHRGHRAVDEARVQEPQPESRRGGRTHGALAARGRPVQGDDDAAGTPAEEGARVAGVRSGSVVSVASVIGPRIAAGGQSRAVRASRRTSAWLSGRTSPDGHGVQPQRPDPDAHEAADRRPDLPEHAPQLALPALVDGDADPGEAGVRFRFQDVRQAPVLGVGLAAQAGRPSPRPPRAPRRPPATGPARVSAAGRWRPRTPAPRRSAGAGPARPSRRRWSGGSAPPSPGPGVPTGYRRAPRTSSAGTRSSTVWGACRSLTVEATPAGLCRAR